MVLSTRLRPHLSKRTWKTLHLSAYPAFALLTAHGMSAGSDHLGLLYAMAVAAVTFTSGLRLTEHWLRPSPGRDSQRQTG